MTREANVGGDIWLSKLTGIPSRSLNEWRREGIFPDLREDWDDEALSTTITAIIEHLRHSETTGEYKEARLRLTLAQAEEKELGNSITKGEIVRLEELQPHYEKMVSSFRAKLLNIPKALSPALEGELAINIEMILEKAVHEALNELSQS